MDDSELISGRTEFRNMLYKTVEVNVVGIKVRKTVK